MVLFMITVHTGKKKVQRLRKRPAKTSTNARTSRAPFGDLTVKKLDIPDFIDLYNHFMNGVDVADQLRCYYDTQRVHLKTWNLYGTFYWTLQLSIVTKSSTLPSYDHIQSFENLVLTSCFVWS